METPKNFDVLIIGAGPAGSTAAQLLNQQGYRVCIIERDFFPRRTIGESLLPQCMHFLEQAGFIEDVHKAGFQHKEGALFQHRAESVIFKFADGYTQGWPHTYQVKRDQFDLLLVQKAINSGVSVLFGHTVCAFESTQEGPILTIEDIEDKRTKLQGRFVLDASGFGRVLPRLLDLNVTPDTAPRSAVFAHMLGDARGADVPTEHVLISIHPERKDVWYWLIPFSDGTSSVGISAPPEYLTHYPEAPKERLRLLLNEEPNIAARTEQATFAFEPHQITGYANKVKTMYGRDFALLGNAGEFLDPIFSSGITLAMQSSILACEALSRQLSGQVVDWDAVFVEPLMQGVETFRTYVAGWYDGTFKDILFYPNKPKRITSMLSSILAGYVWDTQNPFVAKHQRRYNTLVKICQNRI